MDEQMIAFPNLGIQLGHVGKSFEIAGIRIAFYGVIIGIAILVGILLAEQEARRTKQDTEMYLDFAIYAVVCSIVGARLYYVAFSWEHYKGNLLEILNLRHGGLAIYGGVIAAVLTLVTYAKVKKQNFWLMGDTGCIGLIAGQAIGRWGNFFNREAFGEYTDNLLAMRLPESAVRSGEITQKMREHMVDGCIQVHPTFLYESMWNLGVLLFLLLYRRHKKFDGELVFMYLGGYGLGRVWIEGLRTDQLTIGSTGVAVSQVLAGCMVCLSAVALTVNYIRLHREKGLADEAAAKEGKQQEAE